MFRGTSTSVALQGSGTGSNAQQMPEVTRPWTRLAALGGLLALQTVLLAWALASPETLPGGSDLAIVGLGVVSAGLFALDARWSSTGESWWRPDWRQWALAGLFPGANLGIFAGYLLRHYEATHADEPSGYWKRPLVAGVIVTTLGSLASRRYFDPNALSPVGAVVVVGVLVVVGFTFVAAYYDIQYVSLARTAAEEPLLADGIYWLVVLGFPIPGRVFFLAIYVFRRRMMLGRLAGTENIESLPTGVAQNGTDGNGEGNGDPAEDSSDEQPTLPVDRKEE